MGIDASIALAGRAPQIDNPLNYLAQAQQIQQMQNQNALLPLERQQMQLKLLQTQRMTNMLGQVLARRAQQSDEAGAAGYDGPNALASNYLSPPSSGAQPVNALAPAQGGGGVNALADPQGDRAVNALAAPASSSSRNALMPQPNNSPAAHGNPQGIPTNDGIPYSLQDLGDLAMAGFAPAAEMLKVKQAAMQGVAFEPGKTYNVGGQIFTVPQLDKGMQIGPDGRVQALPGYAATNAAIQGAQTATTEGKKLLPLDYRKPDGRPIGGTVEEYLGNGQQPAPQPAVQPTPQASPESVDLNHMTPAQSKAFFALAEAQFALRPHSAAAAPSYNPPTVGVDGHPVPPATQSILANVAQSRDPAQLQQAAAHFTAQVNAAIPEGPQRQAALQSVNSEMQKIAQSWQAPVAPAPATQASGRPQLQSPTEAAQQAAAVQLQTAPQIALRTKEYGDMSDYTKSLNARLSESQALMQRIAQSRDALTRFQAGGGSPQRVQMAQWLQAIPGMSTTLVDKVAGGDLSAAQEFQKYAAQEALETMKQSLASDSGKGSQGNRVSMDLFIKNNPNLETDPRAIEKIFNFVTQQHNQLLDESKTYQQYKATPGNDPTQFPNYWANEMIRRGYVHPEIKSGYAKGVATPANIQALLDKYK